MTVSFICTSEPARRTRNSLGRLRFRRRRPGYACSGRTFSPAMRIRTEFTRLPIRVLPEIFHFAVCFIRGWYPARKQGTRARSRSSRRTIKSTYGVYCERRLHRSVENNAANAWPSCQAYGTRKILQGAGRAQQRAAGLFSTALDNFWRGENYNQVDVHHPPIC